MASAAGLPVEAGEGLWVVDAPLRFLGMQVGRHMAVVRVAGPELLIHSPAPLDPPLRAALDELGEVRFVVPASNLHGHLFMEQYREAYPQAELFAAPGLRRRRPDLDFAGDLGDAPDPRWAPVLDQAAFRGHRLLTEVVFHHRASRTLIVGDLVWNVTRALPVAARLWAGGRTGVRPTPAFRLAVRDRDAARESLRRMLEWPFDSILVGHGEPVDSGGRDVLRAAYSWLGL